MWHSHYFLEIDFLTFTEHMFKLERVYRTYKLLKKSLRIPKLTFQSAEEIYFSWKTHGADKHRSIFNLINFLLFLISISRIPGKLLKYKLFFCK